MSRFYRIQIDSIHLTSDGTNSGTPCKLQIPGLEDLLTPVTGISEPSASGIPQFQTFPWTTGKQFEIVIQTILEDVWNDLKTLLNTALENNTPFTVSGTGDVGNFVVSAMPFPQKPFTASEFINGRIKNSTIRLITSASLAD